jgi:hypothetical protein
VAAPTSETPAGPPSQASTGEQARPPLARTAGAPATRPISGLDGPARDTRYLRFVRWVTPPGRKTRFRLLARLYRVGSRPTGFLRKVSSMLLTSLSSFPRLTLAQARFGRKEPSPASLEVLAKPRFLPGFQRFPEVFAELLGQGSEVISLPSIPRRAGAPAGATAPSDWPFCVALPRRCAGEPAVTYHKSMSQAGTTRSQQGVTGSGSPVMGPIRSPAQGCKRGRLAGV